uniref:Uncharacterized protein n=1 Tax=Nelumbo nucifera TaxID=4432 RepID=A0A822YNA5_NELNU|nr:TPA_asm: hypothetical protein HUJ06_004627 [Nelumbo nucifera]DAD33988.1 TPA_asm: hypothetical protein HUJ06_004628 [Nelumbo nucifera]DAD37178.1 TPA_asm: hypothetical protein HUJ06_007819 [Nelumbo nucifera]
MRCETVCNYMFENTTQILTNRLKSF